MDKLLYLGMSAAKQTMHAQSVNTHNLANVNTAGFRADIATFESVPLEGQGFDSGGSGSRQAACSSFPAGLA